MTKHALPGAESAFSMTGCVALITGGARGIGAATARRFVQSGGRVAVTYQDDQVSVEAIRGLETELGDAFFARVSDAADDVDMRDACAAIETHFSAPIDTAVINAADVAKTPWDQIDIAEWDHMMEVNLRGAFICARHVVPQMRRAGRGAIITMGSVMAHIGDPRSIHYVTTKEGLVGFTRSIARAEGANGITANCIAPGAIASERHYEEGGTDDLGRLEGLQSVRRRGYPDDIATACQYLASPAGSFVTGQVLTVDGGWTNY